MGLKREFVEKWMHAERMKKLVMPNMKRVGAPPPAAPAEAVPGAGAGATVREAAPMPAPAQTATPATAPARVETRSAAPALVPFADMDVWYLSTEMVWTLPDGARAIPVPRGFVTDFASVPASFWAWMPPIGRYGLPAIVHDWLYWDQTLLRHQADDIFHSALTDLGVPSWRRYVLYRGVRWFGGRYWRENRAAKSRGEGRILRLFPDDARITWSQWRIRPGVFG